MAWTLSMSWMLKGSCQRSSSRSYDRTNYPFYKSKLDLTECLDCTSDKAWAWASSWIWRTYYERSFAKFQWCPPLPAFWHWHRSLWSRTLSHDSRVWWTSFSREFSRKCGDLCRSCDGVSRMRKDEGTGTLSYLKPDDVPVPLFCFYSFLKPLFYSKLE